MVRVRVKVRDTVKARDMVRLRVRASLFRISHYPY